MSRREFQRLRSRARTPEEFKVLAEWCQAKSDFYRQRQSSCEAELRGYGSQSSPQAVVKHPTRSQSLKSLAEHYAELAKLWRRLADEYSVRAR